ncbi:MAG TPA: copper amine oxidase N-terminal domain-containing protein [Candidatus Tyrphobacter sp.]
MNARALPILAALVATCCIGASPATVPREGPAIAIVINGETLPLEPRPLLDRGILLVPVRRTILALGLDFEQQGSRMITHVGSKTVVLQLDSRTATVDDARVELDAPAVRRNDVFYAPLRFFTDVLGAQARFDRRAHVVTILSQLVGRSGLGDFAVGNRTMRVGTVTAVDVNSDPPTVTLAFNGQVRTIPITANALISLRDVAANVDSPGELTDIRPGDYAAITVRKNGSVVSVVDEYGSRYGTIAAINGGELVLEDGYVIVPDRDTEIALNGKPAAFQDLLPSDRATIRYNVESGEVREIVAQRAEAQTSAQSGTASIESVAIDATGPLRAGQRLTVTLRGTPGGSATFDIGAYVANVAMAEQSSGVYVGSYAIARNANFVDTPIVGHLQMPDGSAVTAQAAQTLSASGTPPGILSVGPSEGASVGVDTPAIYATFAAVVVPVNPSSVRLEVNGRDVTPECLRTAQFIQYLPETTYHGVVHVSVRVADLAGNATTRSWSFTIFRPSRRGIPRS